MNGERMSRQGFWKIIKYYQESAGIDKDITPHTLRHSLPCTCSKNGADRAPSRRCWATRIFPPRRSTHVVKKHLKDVYQRGASAGMKRKLEGRSFERHFHL